MPKRRPVFFRQRHTGASGRSRDAISNENAISAHDFRFEPRRKRGAAQEFLRRVVERVAKGGCASPRFFGSSIPAHPGRSRNAIPNGSGYPLTISASRQGVKEASAQEFLRRVVERVAKRGCASPRFFGSGIPAHRAGRGTQFRMRMLSPRTISASSQGGKEAQRRNFYGALWSVSQKGAALRRFFMALRGQDAPDLRAASE